MDSRLRVVTQIPVLELWRSDGSIVGPRIRNLSQQDVLGLLGETEVEFVVADVGSSLRWIGAGDRFDFWKREVKPHLAEANSRIDSTSFPDEYCYLASQWVTKAEFSVVLLEKYH